MTRLGSPARELAQLVGDVLHGTFEWCAELGSRLREVCAATAEPGTDDLAGLWQPIFDRLAAEPGLLAGTGVVLSDRVLADRAHWLEWWQAGSDGEPQFLQVDHDPGSVGFYDFAAAPWFAGPRDSGRPVAVGPYVDWAGTDEYMITLAVPVHAGGDFLGVAAADLRAGAFERLLLSRFGPAAPPAALLTCTGRVITSNTPHRLPGDLLPAANTRRSVQIPCAASPWQIALLDEQ